MRQTIKVDDFVTLIEDRPAPSYVGIIGRVADPGYAPPDAAKVYVKYDEGDEFWIDGAALTIVPLPALS